MTNKKLLSVLTVSVLAAVPMTSQAFAGDVEVSSNIGFVSDYVFRGVSQSDESIAVQGGFDVSYGNGLYAGVWGSNVDFDDNSQASSEIDLYAGYAGSINDISYDVGAIYYAYPGASRSLDYDFWELSLAAGYDFGSVATSASINYSPEFFGETGDAYYYALNADMPLPADLSLSAHVGHQAFDDDDLDDYTDWSIGLGYNYSGFDLSLQYIDTNLDDVEVAEDRIVFGVSRSF